jgi:hypothetical protein
MVGGADWTGAALHLTGIPLQFSDVYYIRTQQQAVVASLSSRCPRCVIYV